MRTCGATPYKANNNYHKERRLDSLTRACIGNVNFYMKIIPTLLVIALSGCVKPPEENMSMDKNTEVTTYTESRDLEVAFESLHAYYKINHPQINS